MKKFVYPLFCTMFILGVNLTIFAQHETEATLENDDEEEKLYEFYLPMIHSADLGELIDMVPFMVGGNGRLYEVQHSIGSQARHQTQGDIFRFYHTKGNEISAEWEELWADDSFIMRGTDTSPGNNQYYTLYDVAGTTGSKWAPRQWRVGDIYERNPLVIFYDKSSCNIVASGLQRSWLKFVDYYEQYTFESGITLDEVVELAWLLDPNGSPIESYFYAQEYGLVGWGSNDRGYSHISEVHAPGQRPDNTRETIGCLNRRRWGIMATEINFGPLPAPFRAK